MTTDTPRTDAFYAVEWRESNRVTVYATGRFLATIPPIPKVGPRETAKRWKTAKGASAWMARHAAGHGCRVVRLPNATSNSTTT